MCSFPTKSINVVPRERRSTNAQINKFLILDDFLVDIRKYPISTKMEVKCDKEKRLGGLCWGWGGWIEKARLENWVRCGQPCPVLKAACFTGKTRTKNQKWKTPTVFIGQKWVPVSGA